MKAKSATVVATTSSSTSMASGPSLERLHPKWALTDDVMVLSFRRYLGFNSNLINSIVQKRLLGLYFVVVCHLPRQLILLTERLRLPKGEPVRFGDASQSHCSLKLRSDIPSLSRYTFSVAYQSHCFPLEGSTEKRQMPIALDSAEPRLNVQQGGSHPALLLLTATPEVHLVRPLPDLGHDGGLQAVGGCQAAPQRLDQPQLMQGQVPAEVLERGPGLGVGRLPVGRLELASPQGRLGWRAVAHPVLPLVPLTALDRGPGTEDRLDRLPEPLGPIDDAAEPLVGAPPALDQLETSLKNPEKK